MSASSRKFILDAFFHFLEFSWATEVIYSALYLRKWNMRLSCSIIEMTVSPLLQFRGYFRSSASPVRNISSTSISACEPHLEIKSHYHANRRLMIYSQLAMQQFMWFLVVLTDLLAKRKIGDMYCSYASISDQWKGLSPSFHRMQMLRVC